MSSFRSVPSEYPLPRAGKCLLLSVVLMSAVSAQAEMIDGEDLKDPTRPMGVSASMAAEGNGRGVGSLLAGLLGGATDLLSGGYTVSFIRAGGTDPVAMINDQLVRAGDRVGEAEVVSIDRDRVSLRIDGEVREIMGFDSSVKSRADAR
ncbi:MAG: hypothetical protein H7A06_03000 [Pseudomonadales bacterium]|nr:hypothetical protein [Pseudomonadales bacterium]